MRWTNSRKQTVEDIVHYSSSINLNHWNKVAIITDKNVSEAVKNVVFNSIQNNISAISDKTININVIQVYAPTAKYEDHRKIYKDFKHL